MLAGIFAQFRRKIDRRSTSPTSWRSGMLAAHSHLQLAMIAAVDPPGALRDGWRRHADLIVIIPSPIVTSSPTRCQEDRPALGLQSMRIASTSVIMAGGGERTS